MPSAIQTAVDTYIRAWSEPDPVQRARMVEQCFAPGGRIVTRSREIRGRAALAEEMSRIRADETIAGIRVVSVVDASGTTFRFRAVTELRDGRTLHVFDAGEVDENGQISVLLTFAGPLDDAVSA